MNKINGPSITETVSNDEAWLNALCGPTSATTKNDAQMEARILREVIKKKHITITASPINDLELQAFRDRLRKEQLWTEPFYKQTRTWAMAASLILAVGGGLMAPTLLDQGHVEMENWRGIDSDIAVVTVKSPEQSRAELSTQLSKLGIDVKLLNSQGNLLLEAYIPSEYDDQVIEILRPSGISIGKQGRLKIMFQQEEK